MVKENNIAIVRKNISSGHKYITIPKRSSFEEGDIILFKKITIGELSD